MGSAWDGLAMELFLPDQIVLNEASLALLADVEETARRVNEYRPLPAEVVKRILDRLLGERVYSSNAIEGNTLDLRETISVLETGRLIENKKRDAIEARNLGEATRRISDLALKGPAAHTVEDLLATHKLILKETPDEYWGGRFREQGVIISGAKHQPPDHTMVPALVERVVESLQKADNQQASVLMASWAHWALARVHPFKDGNGRISRLWQDLILFQADLTSAIIRPEDRRDYLAALTDADGGHFDALVQLVATRVLRTFDKYLATIAADAESEEFAREIAGEADARIAEKRHLAYQRWARKMEQLRYEFEICAARVTDKSGRVRIQLRPYDTLAQDEWETIRSGGSVKESWFFVLYIDTGEKSRRYIFFFGKHYPTESDDAVERSENRVSLLVSEDDGSGRGILLDRISACPIGLREVFLVDDTFVARRASVGATGMTYDRGIAPLRVAQDVIRDIVLRRMT